MVAEEGRIGNTARIEGSKGNPSAGVVTTIEFPHGQDIANFTIFVSLDWFKLFAICHGNWVLETHRKALKVT